MVWGAAWVAQLVERLGIAFSGARAREVGLP
jgi:hypothetical protein